MPGYTRAWDAINWLLGSRDADEIDDAVRDTGTDLDERLRDILVDILADPWQLAAKDVVVNMPWAAASKSASAGVDSLQEGPGLSVATVGDAMILFFPIDAPVGSEIKGGSVRCLRTSADYSITARMHKIEADGTLTVLGTALTAPVDANAQDIVLDAVSEVVAAGVFYRIWVAVTSAGAAAPSTCQIFGATWTGDMVLGNP